MEANAALRSIVRRDSGKTYREMLTSMATESGIKPPSAEDLARFDKKRKGKNVGSHLFIDSAGGDGQRRRPSRRRRGFSAPGRRLSDTNERPDRGETLRDTSPFADVWKEAVAGKAIIERFLHGAGSFDYSPIVLMRALLVQTWRPCGANGREPAVGWALGTIFPEFDNLARPIKRRINHAAVAALPIPFRPALLAGVSRRVDNPTILTVVRDDAILRGRRAFERLCENSSSSKLKARRKAIKRENINGRYSHV